MKNKIETENAEFNTLVSCDKQTNGKGQYNRLWDSFNETLCQSFVIEQNEILTLTSLEMSCLVHMYFIKNHQIKLSLKWPNDILTNSGKKVGGILLSNIRKKMLVGIGLNYFENNSLKNYKTDYGFIFDVLFSLDKKNESLSLFKFIIQNRLKPFQVREYWTKNCIHLNKEITLVDAEKRIQGVFSGIGEHGEALIREEKGQAKKYFSGSLLI